MTYTPKNPVRIVTAASLFDGHDASINIMRRILQDMGAEVIHLGHNRSVKDIVTAVLQEGAQGVAISSYQGGHMEYFKYMKDLFDQYGASYVRIFGGGGGVIVSEEKKELENYGIAQIFHPEDGRRLGLEGMIEMIMRECDFDIITTASQSTKAHKKLEYFDENEKEHYDISKNLGLALSAIELEKNDFPLLTQLTENSKKKSSPLVLGMTGTGGAGKSSLIDELVQRFLNTYKDVKIGVVCVDPSKKKTGGALLGDRIRMNSLSRKGTFMRSMASRGSGNEIAKELPHFLNYMKSLDFDIIIAESSGIGQASSAITEVADFTLYVMTSEFGAQSQLEKIDMIDFADFIAINKADRRGSQDAHRDVVKQFRRSRKLFESEEKLPIFLTQASNFNDKGVNALFFNICEYLEHKSSGDFPWSNYKLSMNKIRGAEKQTIVPPDRQAYLAEISTAVRKYKHKTQVLADKASLLGQYTQLQKQNKNLDFSTQIKSIAAELGEGWVSRLENFDTWREIYEQEGLEFQVRGKTIRQSLVNESLSGTKIPKVIVPKKRDWGDRWEYLRMENIPGEFPYTMGVFPLKRESEDPIRQFAGEGSPEKTNQRFHFLSKDTEFKRLSTAFDSVTLYGQDPDPRPDIYGKVGESGVSIATLEDMKKLYAGFDLCDPKTSVSMTINGPAPMILAFFMNAAIDQQIEKKEKELACKLSEEQKRELSAHTLSTIRGTVQADILKEDQGQNTCIFSIDFALKMMGDMQEYFVKNKIRNFYSVSISGYHIAEAGANPITQLALTLSNAFTYVEYYLSRGLNIDDFAPNLSFFFSNGLDPEYNVIGRVARRIWAIAIRDLYNGNERSQKLKYHIQTSGRSLHAQEIDFNDIRTTLQALIAINDNCNSLHTNAYDEAITTPTEESVRRAQAIQMIINKEFGQTKNENPNQGSYFNDWLTDTVEEAVLTEFMRISERGGVLGAMETQYQRGKIQEESLYYEHLKHNGRLPIVGVNTFINTKTLHEDYEPPKLELRRATPEEKRQQLDNLRKYHEQHKVQAMEEIAKLKLAALSGDNIFSALMSASRHCSLYQMSQALYEVGGQYRRNL
ncbi:MAG: methylmalonyl-CoA mutase family protein [Bdellovibrionaceae bacterium]|nr:methylmalonyl-CoA mutase family protein [Pseudobdellovibrionaceae bacterium]